EAFSIVRQTVPGATLRVIGRPAYGLRQLSLIHSSPDRPWIDHRLTEERSRIPGLLRNAAVLVQTSESENFGSAVAEAQGCGVPVVVGHTNGTADYIDAHSQVFEDYRPGSVATAILRVLESCRRDLQEVS